MPVAAFLGDGVADEVFLLVVAGMLRLGKVADFGLECGSGSSVDGQ